MSGFLSSIALTIVFVLLLTVIRGIKGEVAIPFSICLSVFLIGVSLAVLQPLLEYINNIVAQYSIDFDEYLKILFKAVGISLTAAFAADLCRDAGEQAIAARVELLGKCEILALSLPLVGKITDLLVTTLEGI